MTAISVALMSGICLLGNATVATAETTQHGMGALPVTQEELDEFYEQFENATCSVNLDNITSVPTSCDLSTNSDSIYFPPIGDQGGIGSCTAWATTYYQFTYAANKLNNIQTTANNAYSPSWAYNYINGGIDTGSKYTDAYYILKNQGALTLSEMPYNADNYSLDWPTDTSKMMNALNTRLSYFSTTNIPSTGTPITSKTDTDLKEAKFLLSTGHILVINTYSNGLTNWSFKPRYGNSNELVAYRSSLASDGHALAVVGYDDNVCCDVNGNGKIEASERGAFKVANSWGTDWGNDGFIWVLYDALNNVSANKTNNWEDNEQGTRVSIFNHKGVGNSFKFIEVDNYQVNLAGVLSLTTNNRNKLSVDLYRKNDDSDGYTDSISFLNSKLTTYNNPSFTGSLVFDYAKFADPVYVCTNGYYYGVSVNNWSYLPSETVSNISYKIVDNKFNIVKQMSDLATTAPYRECAQKSVMVKCQKGDLNYDGTINSIDVSILLEYNLKNYDLSNLQNYLGDLNNDGIVNLSDYYLINQNLTSASYVSIAEMKELYRLNNKLEKYMIVNNFSNYDLNKISKINKQIQNKMEVVSNE